MNDSRDQVVYERGLAFFGHMASGVSHELKNVLSIINELSGLIDDLLAASRKSGRIEPAQLGRIAEGIAKQIRRGDDHVRHLHHFSHNVDAFDTKAPLHDSVDEIVALCQRIARLKKAELTFGPHEGPAVVVDKVFVWQHLVYECLCLALEHAQVYDTVTVRLARRNAASALEVLSPRPLKPDAVEARLPVLRALAAEVGSTIEVGDDEGGGQALVVAVPS